MKASRRSFIQSIAMAGVILPLPVAIFGKQKQTIFKSPDDCHRVCRVLLNGEELENVVYANTDRGDGVGIVKYYPEPVRVEPGTDYITFQWAKGRVEVELYTTLDLEGLE